VNLNRLNSMGDLLGLFNQAPGQPVPAPQQAPQQTTFDPNDPAVQAAMQLARQQERDARIAEIERLKSENSGLKTQVTDVNSRLGALEKQAQQAAEQAKAAEMAKMKPDEKVQAQLQALQDELKRSREEQQRTVSEANKRVEAWQIESEKNAIIAKHNGQVDPLALDTSSIEALRASEGRAVQTYQATRQHFFSQFQQEMQFLQQQEASHNQQQVEQLPSYPPGYGMPTPNNAGSPAPAQANGAPPQFTHPQIDGGQSYAAVRQMAHGRVVQQAPAPNGQPFFQPQYPQQQQPGAVQQPQGSPTGPVQPAHMQPQQQQPQWQGQPQQPPQGQQQPLVAPLPDPNRQASDPARNLTQTEVAGAIEHARAIVEQRRGSGGLSTTSRAATAALQADRKAGGHQPNVNLPTPTTGFGGNLMNHPMAAPRPGTV